MKNIVQSKMFKAALVIVVALAFIMPGSAAIINSEQTINIPFNKVPDVKDNDPQVLSPLFICDGYCYFEDDSPANTVDVIIINLDTGEVFDADETDPPNYYIAELSAYDDVDVGETLRYFATDQLHYINVTDYTTSQTDFDNGGITLNLILDEYYTDLIDFPYYPGDTAEGLSDLEATGPACLEMGLDYMWWQTIGNTTCPRWTQSNIGTQKVIYDEIALNSNHITGTNVNARGFQQYLQAKMPLPYDEYGYNFNIKYTGCIWNENWTQTSILGAICIWTDYSTSFADGSGTDDEPLKAGHKPHVPAFIPALADTQGYGRWMAVRGIHTDTKPWIFSNTHEAAMDETNATSQANAINVLGFWVNDPYVTGIGENTYKTGDDFKNNYFKPLSAPGDPYDTEYVAVVEPPKDYKEQSIPTTHIVAWPEPYSDNPMTGVTAAVNFYSTVVGSTKVIHSAVQAMGKLVTLNEELRYVYEQSYPQLPLYIENLADGNDYYIVCFGPEQSAWVPRGQAYTNQVSIAALVDAETCQFKELSYVDAPVDYLPIREADALDIVIDYLGGSVDPRSCETSYVYRELTQFDIDVQVYTPYGTYYVNQDGEVSS